jgi:hypothetical protein
MTKTKKIICLVGAGNIGSRHLQALKRVKTPLDIYVIDPSKESLEMAQKRFDEFPSFQKHHQVFYQTKFEGLPKTVDVAIIATNSDVRKTAIESLLAITKVKYFILEKILFPKLNHYQEVEQLLKKHRSQAWVNCARREMPFFFNLKSEFGGKKIHYLVTGGQWGLASNAIHYIDHMALLTNCNDYTISTALLDPKPVKSKRKGYLELNGTLQIFFKNGSIGTITCYSDSVTPCITSIYSQNAICIINEDKKEALSTKAENEWVWKKEKITIPYQSELTNKIVEKLLIGGKCNLTPYSQSSKIHLTLINALLAYLKKNYNSKINYCPFT